MSTPSSTLILNIGGFNIQINFNKTELGFAYKKLKEDILNCYQGFITDKTKLVNYTIKIIEKKLFEVLLKEKKRFINIYEKKGGKLIISFYQISLIQFQLILRDIIGELLAQQGGFILHASSIADRNKALIFTGKNSSGKSTMIKLLHPQYKALADDTVIIRKQANQYFFYQTPFIEKEDWIEKASGKYLLKKVFFLRKAKFFKLEKIVDKDYILNRLLKQFWTIDQYGKKQLHYLTQFVAKFNNFYFFYFNKDKEKLIKLLSSEEKNL
ncbi:MAG: hypothetical protein NC935_08440 [Candidatus Omnitrophica bacterium]|nr:hypothetical protein [Candidatus Omnitrophota bacterium]